MIKSIVAYVNFYFPTYKTQFYPDNFIKACLVYQYLYAEHFQDKLDISQIIYKLSGDRYSLMTKSPTIANHLIFNLGFKSFWKTYRIGRGCVYVVNTPFKESEVLGYLIGIIYWIFHSGVM